MRKIFILINVFIIFISISIVIFIKEFYELEQEVRKFEINGGSIKSVINKKIIGGKELSLFDTIYLTLRYINLDKLKNFDIDIKDKKYKGIFKELELNINNKIKNIGLNYFLNNKTIILYNCEDSKFDLEKAKKLEYYECKVIFTNKKYKLIALPKKEKLSLATDIEEISKEFSIGK